MVKLINLLAEILSRTNLGLEIQYIIESKEKNISFSETILEHLIKLYMNKEEMYRKAWIKTIKKSFNNILKNRYTNTHSPKLVQKDFYKTFDEYNEVIYRNVRDSFNNNLNKNTIPFPKTLSTNNKNNIELIYKGLIDDFINNPNQISQLDWIDNKLEEYINKVIK